MCCDLLLQIVFLVLCLMLTNTTNCTSIGIRSSCDGRSRCIFLQDCDTVITYMESLETPFRPSAVEFLMRQQCGFQDGRPKICCSRTPNNSHQIPNEQSVARKDYPACRVKSQCVMLKHCRPYMDLIKSLEKPLMSSVVDFLRAQQCGFQEGYPKVCCTLLPRSLNMLKHANSETRPKIKPIEKPLAPHTTEDPSTKLDLDHFTTEEVTTVKPNVSNKKKEKLKEKAEALNEAFQMSDFLDFDGPYDLFRRRRFGDNSEIEVEIR